MPLTSTIELRDIILPVQIGRYGADDTEPEHHLLDLILFVEASKILIPNDNMVHVFDYDPMVAEIKTLAGKGHRATQEWLISEIAHVCAKYSDIKAAKIYLRKFPVYAQSGTLGVQLWLQEDDLAKIRNSQ